jgi:hypothetical protein
MSPARIVARETALSAANAVLSLVFFLAMFGPSRPVAWAALAFDGLPQSFMVALMASLVPGLLVGTRLGVRCGPIVGRALLFGTGALAMLGGGGWLWLHGWSGTVAAGPALAAKMAYGALLGALVTPAALVPLFRGHRGVRRAGT